MSNLERRKVIKRNIKALMTKRGASNKDVAAWLGLKWSTINTRFSRPETSFSECDIFIIAKNLNVSTDEFFDGVAE